MEFRLHVFVAIFFASLSAGNASRPYFTVAVFESRPDHGPKGPKTMTPDEIKDSNLKWMEIAAEEAAQREADILIFSEYGTTPPDVRDITKHYAEQVPDPKKEKANPCNGKEEFKKRKLLQAFSCMAQKHEMYIVANIMDIQPCDDSSLTCDADKKIECEKAPKCPEDGNFMYNTNIAFDRDGNLISRYHKNHLYFECLDTPSEPDMTTFQTDFGTFAMIVCFDSTFKDIAEFVKTHDVDHLIFSTHWFDDILPFNAIEWQQSWALANHVNFFAANKHVPGNATMGSGIYHKVHGALSYTYNPDGKSKLLVSKVPLDDTVQVDTSAKVLIVDEDGIAEVEERGDSFSEHCYEGFLGPPKDMFHDHRCGKHQTAHYTLKKLEKTEDKLKSCDNKFCCHLKYEADSMAEDYYLAAFNGINDVRDYFQWKEETCLLVRCDPFEDTPCVMFPSTSKTMFKSVELKATFQSESIYPTVTKSHHRLAPKLEWSVKKKDGSHVLKFASKSSDPVLKVGLMGRNYKEDPPFTPFLGNYKYFN